MFVEIAELELHPIDYQEEFPPDAIDLGEDARQLTLLKTSGRAQLVEEHHGKRNVIKDIRLNGELATRLLLEDAIREQVLLSVPLKVVCREDCKGLCPSCGKNRNTDPCSCARPFADPRWSALKEIREKLDH
jgi:uncharacterized protein